MAATEWWVVVNVDATQYTVISTTVGSAADKALKSSNPQTTINGTDWIALTTTPYPTRAAAAAALPALENFEKNGKGPGTPTVPPFALGPNQPAGQAAQKTISNPLDFLQSIGDFFGRLTEANTWLRLAKIVIGGTLIVVGVAHLVGAEKIVKDVAEHVPPVIPV